MLNIADPTAPTVADIAWFITRHLGYTGYIVKLDQTDYPPKIGRTPWSLPRPFVVDCGAALDLGYLPKTTYADAVKVTCDWLLETVASGEWQQHFPVLAAYPRDHFDYAAEEAFFSARQ
ncbi:hypothetical protein [Rhodopila sp.]|uniref:hypothetical protein n=1 Tax=Rhodopila sp. TaxID=2480087 RepID=UPI003D13D78A